MTITSWIDFLHKYYPNNAIPDNFNKFTAYSVIIQSQNKISDNFLRHLNKKWLFRSIADIEPRFMIPSNHPLYKNKYFRDYLKYILTMMSEDNKIFQRYKNSKYTLVCHNAVGVNTAKPFHQFFKNLNDYYLKNAAEGLAFTYDIREQLREIDMQMAEIYINFNSLQPDKKYEEDLRNEYFRFQPLVTFGSRWTEKDFVKLAVEEMERQRSQKRKRVDNHTSYLNNMTREEAMRELDITSTDEATVRKAYIKKARKMHPDKQRSKSESEKEKAKKMMQTLNRAKDILAPRLRYYLYQLKF